MRYLILTAALLAVSMCKAQDPTKVSNFKSLARQSDYSKYTEAQLAVVADTVLAYQFPSGGWPKNQRWNMTNLSTHVWASRQDLRKSMATTGVGSTIDNNATTCEILFLAKVYATYGGERYRESAIRGIKYLLDMQYDNGGFPQFWPSRTEGFIGVEPYSDFITFNDNAMPLVLYTLDDVAKRKAPYDALKLDEDLRVRCQKAYDKGIRCVLDCQIRKDGKLTVWCQQHNHITLKPEHARIYELPAFSALGETCDLLNLLMSLKNPSDEVVASVSSAIEWLENHAIHDMKVVELRDAQGKKDIRLVEAPGAPLIWARFYDLETEKPFYCDRDGIKRSDLSEISAERRNGYRWLGSDPARIIEYYKKWIVKVRK